MLSGIDHPLEIPSDLYRAEQVKALDAAAIKLGSSGAELMERAGQAAFKVVRNNWPTAHKLSIVCGVGNNAGDGFVLARLAKSAGYAVEVLQVGSFDKLKAEALENAKAYRGLGGEYRPFENISKTDLIIDALFGTGLERPVSGEFKKAVQNINKNQADCLSLDIPSGLNSDTGKVIGACVKACCTISFVGLKQGLFTAGARDYCGKIIFNNLQIHNSIYRKLAANARLLNWFSQKNKLKKPKLTAHKGQRGHLLIIGGAPGYSGAGLLAAKAALRCGAGLVSLATHPEHASFININQPEIMAHSIESKEDIDKLLKKADSVVLGPGLGTSNWGHRIFNACFNTKKPLLIDADGLNLLAKTKQYIKNNNLILTPHPGEAARLLETSIEQIEKDRFQAHKSLCLKYGATVVLKGAGSLVGSENTKPQICVHGNPGMASAGMGDVLSGIIGSFMAQGLKPEAAGDMGVCLHSAAADKAARNGEAGLIASDLFAEIRKLLL